MLMSRTISLRGFILLILLFASTAHGWQIDKHGIFVKVLVRPNLDSLLFKEDTDGDRKITIDDFHIRGTDRGDKRFWIVGVDGNRYEVDGVYYLSNLLQALKMAEDDGKDTVVLGMSDIFEAPVKRISESIKNLYWAGLTRRVDERGLEKIFKDEKVKTIDGFNYVYVPFNDTLAYNYFSSISMRRPEFKMRVVKLPQEITPNYVQSLNGREGILTLKLIKGSNGEIEGEPFVVPGGRFNEMYGWDSYFIVLGLLEDGKVDLAKSMVDNFVYEINHYGKILNANRTYYLTRSQPPFFMSMVLAVYHKMKKGNEALMWLKKALEAAIKDYYGYWMGPTHLTKIGLNRYYDNGIGPPPEVEPGRYEKIFSKYAKEYGMDLKTFKVEYLARKIKVPSLDEFFLNDRSMRESGHDASYRLQYDCTDLATVDLNSLLYKDETDIANTIMHYFGGRVKLSNGKVERAVDWVKKADRRKNLINKYLWNEKAGMYFDFNFVKGRQSNFVSATTFYPLWANVASDEQARMLVEKAIPLLEMPGGIVGSTEKSRGLITDEHPQTQWDYPFGWAPHQILVWTGLNNYGYNKLATRLAYKWLYTITINAFNYNGTIAEKYDVVNRSSQVFAEYGNVGTKFSYITKEGFGWTNSSYVIGLKLLSRGEVLSLNKLIPPEWIFQSKGGIK